MLNGGPLEHLGTPQVLGSKLVVETAVILLLSLVESARHQGIGDGPVADLHGECFLDHAYVILIVGALCRCKFSAIAFRGRRTSRPAS